MTLHSWFQGKKINFCCRLESTPKKWGIPNFFTFGVKMWKKFSQPLAFDSRQGCSNVSLGLGVKLIHPKNIKNPKLYVKHGSNLSVIQHTLYQKELLLMQT